MSSVRYRVQIGWSGRNSGGFVLDTSHMDVDGFTADHQFSVDYAGAFDDVTDRALELGIKIGRDQLSDSFRAGTCDIKFNDPDGFFNPRNPDSPVFNQLRPMRPTRVSASVDDGVNWFQIFNGWGRTGQAHPDWGDKYASWHAEDLYMWLNNEFPVIASLGSVRVDEAIAAVLDAIHWDNPAFRNLETAFITLEDFSADGSKSALGLISDLLQIEQGMFFFSGDGVATFLSRYHWVFADPIGTIDLAQSVTPGFDLDRIKNTASVTAESPGGSGTPQDYQDDDSISEFGTQPASSISSPFISDEVALGLAQYLVQQNKDPNDPVWGIGVSEGPAGYLPIMLTSNPGDRVTITDPSADGDYVIQRVQHRGAGGELHSTTWGLVLRSDVIPMILDIGQLDVAQFIA